MKRHELTDEQWAALAPLLPAQRPAHGRPANDHRTVLNGILWILRTGAPWRDMPERYGNGKTAYSRFTRWQEQGVWMGIFAALQQQAAAEGRLDWAVHFVDSTNIRAHPQAAGAKKGEVTRGEAGVAVAGGRRCICGVSGVACRWPGW